MVVCERMSIYKSLFLALVIVLVGMVVSIDTFWWLKNSIKATQYGYIDTKDVLVYEAIRTQSVPAKFTSGETAYESLIFVGDVLLARNIESLMKRFGNSYPFQGINFNEYAALPAVIGNFESSIPKKHRFTDVNMMQFSVHEVYLSAFREAGFTHLSLANNHALDFGTANFRHTNDILSAKDFDVFGHPTQLSTESFSVIEVSGQEFAIMGLHVLYAYPDVHQIKELFTAANKVSDHQVVFIHWGEEYESMQNQAQRQFAEILIEAGADLIIGHHPHVVQGVEIIHDTPVFYSLGNFIFDQYFSEQVQTGLMLLVDFAIVPTIYLLPVESMTNTSQPRILAAGPHQKFLADLSQYSDLEAQSFIKQGSIPWLKIVASSSKIAMIK